MLIASANPIEHVMDHPWPGWTVELFGMEITLMSSGIAVMILVALLLAVVLICVARRRSEVPRGLYNVSEALVVFVRDMIAKPTLKEHTNQFLPYLLTLFVFVLGMNLIGIVPLKPITAWLGSIFPPLANRPIGGTATSIPTVTAGLAATTLLSIFGCGLWEAARRKRQEAGWPLWMALPLSPWIWFTGLSPQIEGPIGEILRIPLALLELIGAAAKCFALMIRLAANMLAGHVLIGVLMMFALQAVSSAIKTHPLFFGVSIACVFGMVAATIIDLIVAILQAYIFTFLTAMFLGLYVEPEH